MIPRRIDLALDALRHQIQQLPTSEPPSLGEQLGILPDTLHPCGCGYEKWDNATQWGGKSLDGMAQEPWRHPFARGALLGLACVAKGAGAVATEAWFPQPVQRLICDLVARRDRPATRDRKQQRWARLTLWRGFETLEREIRAARAAPRLNASGAWATGELRLTPEEVQALRKRLATLTADAERLAQHFGFGDRRTPRERALLTAVAESLRAEPLPPFHADPARLSVALAEAVDRDDPAPLFLALVGASVEDLGNLRLHGGSLLEAIVEPLLAGGRPASRLYREIAALVEDPLLALEVARHDRSDLLQPLLGPHRGLSAIIFPSDAWVERFAQAHAEGLSPTLERALDQARRNPNRVWAQFAELPAYQRLSASTRAEDRAAAQALENAGAPDPTWPLLRSGTRELRLAGLQRFSAAHPKATSGPLHLSALLDCQPQLVEWDGDLPALHGRFEALLNGLNLRDPKAPHFVHLSAMDPEWDARLPSATCSERAGRAVARFLEKLTALGLDPDATGQNLWHFEGSKARRGALNVLATLLPTLEMLAQREPDRLALKLAELVGGFLYCETAQAQVLRNVLSSITKPGESPGSAFADQVAGVVQEAKEAAFYRAFPVKMAHQSNAIRQVVGPLVGLAQVDGFEERLLPVDLQQAPHCLLRLLQTLTPQLLAARLCAQFETAADRALLAEGTAPGSAATLRQARAERPLTFNAFALWAQTVAPDSLTEAEAGERWGLELDALSGTIETTPDFGLRVLEALGYLEAPPGRGDAKATPGAWSSGPHGRPSNQAGVEGRDRSISNGTSLSAHFPLNRNPPKSVSPRRP